MNDGTWFNDPTIPHRTMKNTPTRRSKKRGSKLHWSERLILVRAAESHLKSALEFAKGADAPMLAGRIRAAIKSAGGAIRHAKLAPYREERQARKKALPPLECTHELRRS